MFSLPALHLLRLALEQETAGAMYHGVADEGVPVYDLAELIGRHLNLPVVAKPSEEAADHFGWLGHFLRVDCPAPSRLTQQRLGWLEAGLRSLPTLSKGTSLTVDPRNAAATAGEWASVGFAPFIKCPVFDYNNRRFDYMGLFGTADLCTKQKRK